MLCKNPALRPCGVVFGPLGDFVEQARSGCVVKQPGRQTFGQGTESCAHHRCDSIVDRLVDCDPFVRCEKLWFCGDRGEEKSCHAVTWMRLYRQKVIKKSTESLKTASGSPV